MDAGGALAVIIYGWFCQPEWVPGCEPTACAKNTRMHTVRLWSCCGGGGGGGICSRSVSHYLTFYSTVICLDLQSRVVAVVYVYNDYFSGVICVLFPG